MISQLFDQYLNFIVAEPDLFSLGMQKEHTYWALNSGQTSDAELEQVVDKIVSGLFSVIVTMGRCSDFAGVLLTFRRHSYHSLSQGRRGGNGGGAARSQAARPHPQL